MPSSSRTVDLAAEIRYDPAGTGLAAVEVQSAIDELDAAVSVVAAAYRFGASGTISTGQKAPTHRVRAAGVAFQIDLTLASGTATARVEASHDGGATRPTVVATVALASGKSATATASTSLAAGTLLRVDYTAAAAAVDPVATLYVREAGAAGAGGPAGVASAIPPVAFNPTTGAISLDESGLVHTTGDETIAGVKTLAGNTGLAGGAQYGGGAGVVALKDATTMPATNPAGGLVLAAQGGGLKVVGPTWQQSLAGTTYTQIDAVTIANTAAESGLTGAGASGTLYLPAGFWTRGKAVRVRLGGQYSTAGAAVVGTFKAWLGGTALGQVTVPFAASQSAMGWTLEFEVMCHTAGTSGGCSVGGTGAFFTAGVGGSPLLLPFGFVTINTTAGANLATNFAWAAASPSNSLMCLFYRQEIHPPAASP